MEIVKLRAFAVLAAAFVAGVDAREQPAVCKTDETRKNIGAPAAREENKMNQDTKGKHATVNGLRMYYEIHGSGRPLVLLHGAFGFATVYPALAKDRQVIAVELQGHGHTADIDRPLTYEQMADDTAALLNELKIEQADFFGYSMGGNVGLAVAIRHPQLVRKLAVNGSHAGKMADAYEPETVKQFNSLPADFAPPMLKDPYDKVAPDPKQWPTLVAKVKKMGQDFKGFTREELTAIKAQVLITQGDRDGVRPEHAVEMFRLIPSAQLAVFPGADHFLIFQSPEKLLPTIAAFLNAPVPEPKKPERGN
jgi:pimeloyl-ACP methyl ester carboxylesterase